MNAVEIADAISDLFQQDFDPAEFPFAFLEAFDNKPTTIQRLRAGNTNASDLPGGVLQKSNIHLAVCALGAVGATLAALRTSPKTAASKAKFILATDGEWLEAEDLRSGDPLATTYAATPAHFGFFLELGGISTVSEIKENPIDIRATGRLNKLYVELLKENPEWTTEARRPDMNHLMARLIFCFFAEDTHIFHGDGSFTDTVKRMSEQSGANVHEVLGKLFEAMNLSPAARKSVNLPLWAEPFPYVNGGLFSGSLDVPRFTRIARSYLLAAGDLNWREINPDIFGSMIQAVADDEERGALGMHYTSVPNILKVLNPLFLDDLRAQLERAGEHKQSLLRLRERMARIRVFDPACGSGNFLVIAYKEMRKIEAEINRRRGESERSTDIPLTNFRGIEIRDFAAEIARLALIIAEYQCDVLYRGEKLALAEFLPLDKMNWIVWGNALRLNWLEICPTARTAVKIVGDDLFSTPKVQPEIDFSNEGGETYICGNPPYKGSKWQSPDQKSDLANAWMKHPQLAKITDFVTGWFARYFDYVDSVPEASASFVATNSVCQGQQASTVWPIAFRQDIEVRFAYEPFKWSNLASKNAGVTVIVLGLGKRSNRTKRLYDGDSVRECTIIGPYLVPNMTDVVEQRNTPIGPQSKMVFGNMPRDGGYLFLDTELATQLKTVLTSEPFVKRFVGSDELISGKLRFCLWIEDQDSVAAKRNPVISERLNLVSENRQKSPAQSTQDFAHRPHRFVQIAGQAKKFSIVVPRVSSENRDFLPIDLLTSDYVIGDRCFALYDAPLWNMALISSRLHWVWISTVCVRLEMRFSYSNTLGWNTFPVPTLTASQKADLTRCAEDILLAREAHFPATIADLYDPEAMPDDLRRAHDRNDETLERIYIGRRFRNDTERLEKLFDMYTKMTAANAAQPATTKAAKPRAKR